MATKIDLNVGDIVHVILTHMSVPAGAILKVIEINASENQQDLPVVRAAVVSTPDNSWSVGSALYICSDSDHIAMPSRQSTIEVIKKQIGSLVAALDDAKLRVAALSKFSSDKEYLCATVIDTLFANGVPTKETAKEVLANYISDDEE